jgi:hypothetical protein
MAGEEFEYTHSKGRPERRLSGTHCISDVVKSAQTAQPVGEHRSVA